MTTQSTETSDVPLVADSIRQAWERDHFQDDDTFEIQDFNELLGYTEVAFGPQGVQIAHDIVERWQQDHGEDEDFSIESYAELIELLKHSKVT